MVKKSTYDGVSTQSDSLGFNFLLNLDFGRVNLKI